MSRRRRQGERAYPIFHTDFPYHAWSETHHFTARMAWDEKTAHDLGPDTPVCSYTLEDGDYCGLTQAMHDRWEFLHNNALTIYNDQEGVISRQRKRLRQMERAAVRLEAAKMIIDKLREPVPMLLTCPMCCEPHIDGPSPGWANPPHKTHLCRRCGHLWRPANIATVGVERLP